MACKIVCNIPHSNTSIPEWALKDMLLEKRDLTALAEFMADKDVDKLWDFVPNECKQVAELSRLVLDVERFRRDEDEPMSAKGMGLYYTHTPMGECFRERSADTYARVLFLYDTYHKALEDKVTACLESHGKCILLDCHSFHDEMTYTDYCTRSFPDVCIGVNGRPSKEAQLLVDVFSYYGYSVKINEPFAGALVPLKYLSDARVTGVMIELNRRIYSPLGFEKIRSICKEVFDMLNAE